MKKRKILIIGNSLRTAVLFRYSLIKTLVENGHCVELAVKYNEKTSIAAFNKLNVKVHNLSFMRQYGFNPIIELLLIIEIFILQLKVKPDVVFSYFIKPSIWSMIASKILSIKNRVSMIEGRGSYLYNIDNKKKLIKLKSKVMQILIKFSLSLSNRVIVLNDDDKKYFEELGVKSNIYMLDGIGVDLVNYTYIKVFPKIMSVGFIGRLSESKGVHNILDLIEYARAKNLNWKFYFAGDFEDSEKNLELKKRFLQVIKGNKNVEWFGFCDDIDTFFKKISILVLPSKYGEGLPRSLMESFAFGRPVIGSMSPGIAGAIDDGIDGFRLRDLNHKSIYNKILLLENNFNLLQQMSKNARYKAKKRFSLNQKNIEQIQILIDYD